MDIQKILGVEAHWNINKAVAEKVGLEGALLLAHLISFSNYFGKKGKLVKTKYGDGFFSQTTKQIEDKTFIPRRGQEKALKKLQEVGFIEIILAGNPARKHFRIQAENIFNFLLNSEKKENQETQENSLPNKFARNEQTEGFAKQDCTENPNKFVQNEQTIYKEEKEINKNNIILSNDNIIEQAQDFYSYKNSEKENIENSENELEKEKLEKESLKNSPVDEKLEEEKGEEIITYGKKEINDILAFLKKSIGVSDFKESQNMQRIYGKNIFSLGEKIGKEEFVFRLKNILQDSFKAKNCNSLNFLYRELKAFIHSPVMPTTTKQNKTVTFG